jgi:hypothetical protein
LDDPLTERRRDARFRQPAIAGTRALLRPGYAVALIDLSRGGALIEGPKPLRPGSRVHLQLITERRAFGIAAHVVRCSVSSLDAAAGVQYRGALRFDHRCENLWDDGGPGGREGSVDAEPSEEPGASDGGIGADRE